MVIDGACMRVVRWWTVAGLVVLALVALGDRADAAVPTHGPIGTQGVDDGTGSTVRASTSLTTRLYLGGDFWRAGGRDHRNAAAIDMTTRLVDHGWQVDTNGPVHAMAAAPDGSGVYVGGEFTTVNGVARRNFAKVHPVTGALLAGQVDVDGPVLALAVRGDRVYVGGEFRNIGGRPRHRLAALEHDAVLTTWFANANGRVRDLKLSANGSTLYVAGSFTSLGSEPATGRVARVRAADGRRRPLPINFQNSYTVLDLALSEDQSTLFMAVGGPPSIGGNRTRAVRVSDGALLWQYDHESDSQALLESDGVLYVGGHFDYADAAGGRTRLMALDSRTGGLVAWIPRPNSVFGVWDLDPSPWGLVATGDFTQIDGAARPHVAVYDQVLFDDPGTPAPTCSASVHPSGRVVLRWGSWMGEQVYSIRRDGQFSGKVENGGLAYSDRRPSPGLHRYEVRVQEIGVVTDIDCGVVTVPAPPVLCRTTVRANGQVELRWDAWPEEDTYVVRRDGAFLVKVLDGGLAHRDEPGVGSYTYLIRIKENGLVRDVHCGPVTVPPPDWCRAGVGADGDVELRWHGWPGEDTYIVRRDGVFLTKVSRPAHAHIDTTATSGRHSYLLRIKHAGVVTNIPCGSVEV